MIGGVDSLILDRSLIFSPFGAVHCTPIEWEVQIAALAARLI
jgi:hypothetical protein